MVAVFTGVLANFVFNVPSWGLWALVGFLVTCASLCSRGRAGWAM